jgi:hypothetical protein
MTEVAVIIESHEEITPEDYLGALEAWTEFCRHSLHEMWKTRKTLENDKTLN